MLDSKLLKENPQNIEDMLRKRGMSFPLDDLISLDKKRRQLIVELQDFKHRKNVLAHLIAQKKKDRENADSIDNEIHEMKEISSKILEFEKEQNDVKQSF
jgi:seryl-tRNA synthetase